MIKIWKNLLNLVEEGKSKPTMYTEGEFQGLESLPKASDLMRTGKAWGTIPVTVEDDGKGKL